MTQTVSHDTQHSEVADGKAKSTLKALVNNLGFKRMENVQVLSEPKNKTHHGEMDSSVLLSVRVAVVDQFWPHSNIVFKEKLVNLNPPMHLLNSS